MTLKRSLKGCEQSGWCWERSCVFWLLRSTLWVQWLLFDELTVKRSADIFVQQQSFDTTKTVQVSLDFISKPP